MAGYGMAQMEAILLAYLAGLVAAICTFAVAMNLPALADTLKHLQHLAIIGARWLWQHLLGLWRELDEY